MMRSDLTPLPSLQRSLLLGGVGFSLASLCVFATVAFAERFLYQTFGLYGAYLIWTALFILLGGGALTPITQATMRAAKFYVLFCAAFFCYAVGWVAAYFILRDGIGEWAASFAGSVLMAMVFAAGFKTFRSAPLLSVILFVAHSAGYFLGSILNAAIGGKTGMLLWGAAYGLFLGAGLGATLHLAQRSSQSISPLHPASTV